MILNKRAVHKTFGRQALGTLGSPQTWIIYYVWELYAPACDLHTMSEVRGDLCFEQRTSGVSFENSNEPFAGRWTIVGVDHRIGVGGLVLIANCYNLGRAAEELFPEKDYPGTTWDLSQPIAEAGKKLSLIKKTPLILVAFSNKYSSIGISLVLKNPLNGIEVEVSNCEVVPAFTPIPKS